MTNNKPFKTGLKSRMRFVSSIYGQVVILIVILSVFLLLAFGAIFESINKDYVEKVIRQSGNNVGLLVKGALYQHMLENDKTAIQNHLNLVNTMPGILDINMYDQGENLVYSSFSFENNKDNNPNCTDCHENIESMFPDSNNPYRIVQMDSECDMSVKNYNARLLLIREPVINEPSCYTAACHAHNENDEVLGSFVIRLPLEELDKKSMKSVILALISTLVLTSLFMFITRRNIKRPLNAIIRASQAVSSGDTSSRLSVKPNQLSDIRMVSIAFNEMLDNLQNAAEELQNWSQQLEYKVQKKTEEISAMQNELIHVEKIASLGKLSSCVAHEINNPLSAVLTYTKLVQRQLKKHMEEVPVKDSMLNYLGVIETETKRCGDIVKGLLEFSRKDKQDFTEASLHIILDKSYKLMAHQLKISNISFVKDYTADSDLVLCNENQIKQAVIAILLNSSEAVSDGGEIILRTSNPGSESIRFEIIDNGNGINPEDLPHIFEPFFSTKEKVRGTGLGLAIVHGIVQNHNGSVEAQSKRGQGTNISITLPLVKSKTS